MTKFDPASIKTDFEKAQLCLGIDEAGRGPVLGPLVYACAYWDKKYTNDIKKYFKFDDSKKLRPEVRQKMFEEMEACPNLIRFEKVVLTPDELSYKMLKRNKISLNEISQDAAGSLIIAAKRKGANIKEVFVDTVGPPDKYREHLKKQVGDSTIDYTVESKADAKYPCVSAASIVAKVTRDNIVENWEYVEKEEHFHKRTGSGYPSDPYTKNWLRDSYNEIFGFPSFARFSWKTISNIFKENKHECEWENYVDEEKKPKVTPHQPSIVNEEEIIKGMQNSNFYNVHHLDLEIDI